MVEKDPTQGIELQETQAQRVPQWRRRIHFGEYELRESNPCVSLWFASLLISLAITLCFRFDLLGCVVSVCARTWNILDITRRDTTPSYICARVKRGRNSDIGHVLHRTGLTGHSNRSDRLPVLFLRLSLVSVWPVSVLILFLSADLCRNLRTPIHPPLGDIQRSFQLPI